MNEKFTPGPWGADNDEAGTGLGLWKVWSKPNDADVGCRAVLVGLIGREDDARLTAAAPELYEALEQILDDMGKDQFCCCPAAKAMGVAALAKARGEK